MIRDVVYTTDTQGSPAVGIESSGKFIVVWHSSGSSRSDTSAYSTQGQRYGGPVPVELRRFINRVGLGNRSSWTLPWSEGARMVSRSPLL